MVKASKEKKASIQPDRKKAAKETASPGPDSPSADKKRKLFNIDIFRGWCKCCGICAAFCPRECIKLDDEGSPYLEDSGRCTGCGWCELHCPDFAISVHEKKAETAGGDDV
jgi:2-oxoglutarate ferredoxin oxidoreductase subunit delta